MNFGSGVMDPGGEFLRFLAGREAYADALPWQDMSEQRVGRAVKLRGGNDVAAVIGDICEGVEERRLPCRGTQRADAAFECGNTLFENGVGRIGDAAVAISLDFEIE